MAKGCPKILNQTVSLEKSYRDQRGEWQQSRSMQKNDLPRAIMLLQKAYEEITLKNPAN